MLNVQKLSSDRITYTSNSNRLDVQKAYRKMNQSVYVDYVNGDISLIGAIGNKINNLWNVLTHHDPALDIKARMIEESLKNSARSNLSLNVVA